MPPDAHGLRRDGHGGHGLSRHFLALEWHAAEVFFFDELVKDRKGPLIEKGYIKVPDRPGLGIELDEGVAYKYRKRGEPFFAQPA